MPYFGWVEVEVRLMREGHGPEGKDAAPVATTTVRIEEREAREYVAVLRRRAAEPGAETQLVAAVLAVLIQDDCVLLRDRWAAATRDMSPEKMRAALEVLER